MNFYLKTPYGFLNLDNVERCLRTRVSLFLLRKQDSNTSSPQLSENVNKNLDCLVAGSSYDMVGHYMVRLLIIYSSEVKDFLIESEIDLFKERLSEKIESSKFIQSCRIALRHIQEILGMQTIIDNSNEMMTNPKRRDTNLPSSKKSQTHDSFQLYVVTLKLFCKSLKIPQIADHFLVSCNDKCTKYHITVPFQTCLNLVSKRKIHLCKGNAKIFCCNWKEALHEIFECVLIHNVARLRSNVFTMNYIQEDQRITSLFKEIKHIYMKFRSNESYIDVNEQSLKVIKYDQVDKESEYFPPCISNVHKLLKKIHRLKHNDRFYYSLFLKNIGMSLSESILFWKAEYSKTSCCTSVCSHSWLKNERKYIYGIRHLYGLEGARKRYSPPDCHTIQSNMHISSLDHSCPFLYNNTDSLLSSLSPSITSNPDLTQSLLSFRQTHAPLDSCRLYMSMLSGVKCGFESPTEYYFAMKSVGKGDGGVEGGAEEKDEVKREDGVVEDIDVSTPGGNSHLPVLHHVVSGQRC